MMTPTHRHLSVTSVADWAMKVAFASSDFHYVDQHFGSTPRLVVYGVSEGGFTLLKVADFVIQPGHHQDKLSNRIDALEGCMTLYCVAVGEQVFRQLLQVGVRAVRVPSSTPIAQLLEQLQQHWQALQRPAVREKRDPQRFDRLLEEADWKE